MRAAIYARVSTEEQAKEGYSIDAQIRACRELIAAKQWAVAAEYIEQGKSAHRNAISGRPQFRRMLRDATNHQFDVLVFHKLDRFSRNMNVTHQAIDLLEKARVKVVSASESIERATAQGKAFFNMLSVWGQFYSDNLSEETRKGKAERKKQGLYNGQLPYGVAKGPDNVPVADTETHQHLVWLFQMAARGDSDASIAAALNDRGIRTNGHMGSNPWRKDTVRRVLVNRFYLGELPIFEKRIDHAKPVLTGWIPGRHAPLVDPELFESAQRAREQNRIATANHTSHNNHVHALTGLIRCGYCEESGESRRGAMRIQFKPGQRARAICYARIQGEDCPQRSVSLNLYEAQVETWLQSIKLRDDAIDAALAVLVAERATITEPEQERQNLNRKLDRLKDLYKWGDIDEQEYRRERDEINFRLKALTPPEHRRDELTGIAALMRELPELWLRAQAPERNKLLHSIVSKIVVKDGRVEAIIPRPDVLPLVPAWYAAGYRSGSDGDCRPVRILPRYLADVSKKSEELLRQIAHDAQNKFIIELAREYKVSRQTVRRAVRLYGQSGASGDQKSHAQQLESVTP